MDTSHRPRGPSGPSGGHGRGGGRGRGMVPKADRGVYDGKSKRPMIVRKAVDFQSNAITYVTSRIFKESSKEYPAIQPSDAFVKSMLPPAALADEPTSSITGKYVHKVHNKIPHPTFVVSWTLDGRRLFTGNSAGEITMWDGKTFNFVALVSTGRNEAVRAMTWSHSGDYLLTGDGGGYVGYYEPTVKPLYVMQSHRKAIRGLSFSPTDSKFVSCSDDSTLAIWDFATRKSEAVLEGHNWDVRCVDWHPYNSVIVSGAKDKLIKLWDSKSKSNIHTWQGHKGDVSKVLWNQNGNWFLSASRDYSMRIFDIRTMRELQVIRGNGEMCSVAWHPYHEKMFASGDANGDISFWSAGQDVPQGRLYGAHYSAIWDLKWHPFGHILCASANDCFTSFWCRNRPGDKMDDRYNDPNYVAPPSKFELEAQAHAQAAMNAMQAAASAASGGMDESGNPMNSAAAAAAAALAQQQNPEDFASTQKQLIIPGAVGAAATSDWMSILSNGEDSAPGAKKNGASGKEKGIPGLGQASLGLSLRSGGTGSSMGHSGGSRNRLDTRRDDRRSGYHRDDDRERDGHYGPRGGSSSSSSSSSSSNYERREYGSGGGNTSNVTNSSSSNARFAPPNVLPPPPHGFPPGPFPPGPPPPMGFPFPFPNGPPPPHMQGMGMPPSSQQHQQQPQQRYQAPPRGYPPSGYQ